MSVQAVAQCTEGRYRTLSGGVTGFWAVTNSAQVLKATNRRKSQEMYGVLGVTLPRKWEQSEAIRKTVSGMVFLGSTLDHLLPALCLDLPISRDGTMGASILKDSYEVNWATVFILLKTPIMNYSNACF